MRYSMDYHSRKIRCLDRYNFFTAYANATFHISFNLLFKAVPNLVQYIAFEKNIPVPTYASRSLTRPEQRYCVTRKELLAVVEFVHHFRHYLLGREFTLRTDHRSLVWLRNFKRTGRSTGSLAGETPGV